MAWKICLHNGYGQLQDRDGKVAPPTVVTSYVQNFTNPVSLDQWRPNKIAHPGMAHQPSM